jgi:hypothetical protein
VITGATGSTTVTGDLNLTDDNVTVNLSSPAPAASVESARVTITG